MTTDSESASDSIVKLNEADRATAEGHARLLTDIQSPLVRNMAEKLAMFDELVNALDDVVEEWRDTDSPFWTSKVQLVRDARALQVTK